MFKSDVRSCHGILWGCKQSAEQGSWAVAFECKLNNGKASAIQCWAASCSSIYPALFWIQVSYLLLKYSLCFHAAGQHIFSQIFLLSFSLMLLGNQLWCYTVYDKMAVTSTCVLLGALTELTLKLNSYLNASMIYHFAMSCRLRLQRHC